MKIKRRPMIKENIVSFITIEKRHKKVKKRLIERQEMPEKPTTLQTFSKQSEANLKMIDNETN